MTNRMNTYPNDPAFLEKPQTIMRFQDRSEKDIDIQQGLTKREYFAARAMQGLLSCEATVKTFAYAAKIIAKPEDFYPAIAFMSLKLADALIKSLNEKTNDK